MAQLMGQMNLFDEEESPRLKITKPIRLIELFAGIGAQAMGLKRAGANFEHWKVCEFDKYAIKSYNAVHGTDFTTSDITELHAEDLEIEDADKYTYLLCYSFPCTDLSNAGRQAGMSKGSGTRSGLLWEVERLLIECVELGYDLPQILLMENVPQVHGKKNMEDFQKWLDFLSSIGYSNYWKDLNAKDYGVPQNRNRCFMVSCLGNFTYKFPEGKPLEHRLKDYLEEEVDEKYYLSDEITNRLLENTNLDGGGHGCNEQKVRGEEDGCGSGSSGERLERIRDRLPIPERSGGVSCTVRTGGRGSVDRHSWDVVVEK